MHLSFESHLHLRIPGTNRGFSPFLLGSLVVGACTFFFTASLYGGRGRGVGTRGSGPLFICLLEDWVQVACSQKTWGLNN